MKQEIVIKIAMHTDKKRTEAMKIVVSMPGVAYAELHGDEMNQIKVKGDGVDSVYLTKLLRKNVGHAELVSVTPIKPKPTPVFNPCFGWKNVGHAALVSVTPIKPMPTPVFNPCFGYPYFTPPPPTPVFNPCFGYPYFTPPPPIYLHQVPEYNSEGCTIM